MSRGAHRAAAKAILCFISIAAFVAATPVGAAERTAPGKTAAQSAGDDCEARIEKLDASKAEGEERLSEKRGVIDACSDQYKRSKTIARLLNACAKYEEQPVVKQQFAADCELAAFRYGNALRALKAEHGN